MPTLRERFHPRPGFSLFTVLGVTLLWGLCGWQLGRRDDARIERELYARRLLLPAFDADNPPDEPGLRRVHATGMPDWEHVQRVLGRYMWSQPGMQLIVPLHLKTSDLLVDVGWVPEDEVDAIIARERAAGVERTYAGVARPFAEDVNAHLAGGRAEEWRAVSPARMGQSLDLTVPGWILVDGEGLAEDADIPDRVPPVSGWRTTPVQRPHGEYAFTWFSLGLTLLLVWVSMSFSAPAPPSPR